MTTATESLLSRSQSLLEGLNRIQQYERAALSLAGLTTRHGQLAPRARGLATLVAHVQRCQAAGASVVLDKAQVGVLRTKTQQRKQAFASDKETLVTQQVDQTFQYEYLQPLEGFEKFLEEQLLEAWQRTLRARVPALDVNLLAVMLNVPQLRDGVLALSATYKQFEAAITRLPQDDAAVAHSLALADDVSRQWQALPTLGPEAEAFVRAATSIGATLEQLRTAEEWLREHGLLGSLRVKFG
jgi:hypothetical protein